MAEAEGAWSMEETIEFLDRFEMENILWDPKHPEHKDRNLVHDAWKRIQTGFSVDYSVKFLKRKKDYLLSRYRKLARKVKTTKTTGKATSEVYVPEWFAYQRMDSFLHGVNCKTKGKNTEVS